MFTDFVDRVLDLRGNSTINKFTLKCGTDVNSVCIIRWISNVLECSVSDLDLTVSMGYLDVLPSKIFVSKSLVRLRIESSVVDVEDVFLPKLKTLYLDTILLGKTDDRFRKVISGCHVLDELVLINVVNNIWKHPVSSRTLKRLRLLCWIGIGCDQSPKSVSFDTPNLVYLEYSDYVTGKYPKLNFGSLVEANLNIKMRPGQSSNASYGNSVANAADFLMGICNVQIHHLSSKTLEVLAYCCEPIPMFNNLIHLTIKTRREVGWESFIGWESVSGWESLLALVKNCPNLETLVFDGLNHKNTIKCGDVDGCLCKASGDIPTCLSSSPVKVLKILKFDEICDDDDGMEKQMELVKHFLETMPKLEQKILYYDTPLDEDVIEVSKQLQMLLRVASANCKIQVISNDLS